MQVRNHEQNVESELYNPVVKMIRVVISKPIGKHFGKSKNSNRKRESKKIQQWDWRLMNDEGIILDEETQNFPQYKIIKKIIPIIARN